MTVVFSVHATVSEQNSIPDKTQKLHNIEKCQFILLDTEAPTTFTDKIIIEIKRNYSNIYVLSQRPNQMCWLSVNDDPRPESP